MGYGKFRTPKFKPVATECRECKTMHFFTLSAWGRNIPERCPDCGSMLDETAESIARRSGPRRYARADSKPYECTQCKERFRSKVGLKLHMEEQHGHQ